jgi:iron complex outermembrane receptor protein
MLRALAVLLLSTACSAALAAESDEEVIVTAPLEGSRIESLQGAEILKRDAIIQRQSGTLGDTLSGLPGISSTFYGAGAGRPIIRGLGDDRIRILENGIGAIDASSASPDHAVSADPLDARRIEVLRGAAALAYGGNAVGGVVNVLDETIPTLKPERGYEARGLASYTTVDDGWQAGLGVTAVAGDFVFDLDWSGRETGNFDIPGFAHSPGRRAEEEAEDPGLPQAFGIAPNSFTSVRSYNGGLSLVRNWGFAGAAVKRFETSYGLPPEAPGEPGGHIELEQTRYETRGDVKLNAGIFSRLDYGFQYADYTHTEFEGSGEAGTVFNNDGFEGRLEIHDRVAGGKLTGATGLQFSRSDFEAVGEEAFIQPTETRDTGVFTVQRWDEDSWGFEGGLRLETRDLDNDRFGSRGFTAFSASGGAFVRPAEGWFAGLTVARTERAPTNVELFADGPHLATGAFETGNPALDKEIATSLEASLRYASDIYTLEFSAWHIAFDGYIALLPTGNDIELGEGETLPEYAFTQRDADFDGGEISASARLGEVAGFTITADAAADLVRASFSHDQGDLPRIPPRTFTVGLSAESDTLRGRIELVDIAEQDDVAAFETTTPGSTVLNAQIAWRPLPDQDITLLLDGRNLTDEEVRVHSSFLKDEFPKPGASVRFALAVNC